jgi:uncharacterized protein (DUF488 family)
MTRQRIWTIGHSTRAIDDFIGLLRENQIGLVADVRRFPKSRWHPQFNDSFLRKSLADVNIDYVWLASLGGRRQLLPGSINDGWRNEAFRGYADHTATEEFADGLFELTMLGEGMPTTIMCSEAVWWRCHRSLIADVLCFLGYDVMHILAKGKTVLHPMTAPARIVDEMLTYHKD